VYAGIEWQAGSPEARKLIAFLRDEMGANVDEQSGIGIKPMTAKGSKRLIRKAIQFALDQRRESVTMAHKGNIMKFTEGAFRMWGYDLAESNYQDFIYTARQFEHTKKNAGIFEANKEKEWAMSNGRIWMNDVITDAAFQNLLLYPQDFSVIATSNLNGDYLSDALAAQVGGIGIAPGANINYETGHAIFEATHGTAPKYAGLDKVNPSSVILSGVLMLEHLGWTEAAKLVMDAMEKSISSKVVTYDFARLMDGATEVKCSEFGEELIKNM